MKNSRLVMAATILHLMVLQRQLAKQYTLMWLSLAVGIAFGFVGVGTSKIPLTLGAIFVVFLAWRVGHRTIDVMRAVENAIDEYEKIVADETAELDVT